MEISINGVAITENEVASEASHHADAPSPRDAAACALAIKELLLQRARTLGLEETTGEEADDAVIDALIMREVRVPDPAETECRRYYDSHGGQFRSGDLVEASHILFAVTPNAPLNLIRAQAEATLRQLVAEPERFPGLAAQFSNCPSGARGGNLGQVGRGDTVPEFESALFGGLETGMLPRLVNTRYGFHIVCINRRIEGRQVPFELAAARIAEYLSESVRRKALQQYVRLLAAEAEIKGVDLDAAATLLVQ